jgi:NADP-dependent 3-hydroxy acid dehydrogenase YdfG
MKITNGRDKITQFLKVTRVWFPFVVQAISSFQTRRQRREELLLKSLLTPPTTQIQSERHSMKTFQHPVAIVTGASSGLGLDLIRALLERSYRVVANSRPISKSNDLKSSQDLVFVDGDIENKETAVEVAEAAIKDFGRIDLLVNNAGTFIPNSFADYTEEDFETMVTTNLPGFFYLTQRVLMQMRKQKSGRIVNVSTLLVDQPIAGYGVDVGSFFSGG